MFVNGVSVCRMHDLKEWNIFTFINVYKGFLSSAHDMLSLSYPQKLQQQKILLEVFPYIMITGITFIVKGS